MARRWGWTQPHDENASMLLPPMYAEALNGGDQQTSFLLGGLPKPSVRHAFIRRASNVSHVMPLPFEGFHRHARDVLVDKYLHDACLFGLGLRPSHLLQWRNFLFG